MIREAEASTTVEGDSDSDTDSDGSTSEAEGSDESEAESEEEEAPRPRGRPSKATSKATKVAAKEKKPVVRGGRGMTGVCELLAVGLAGSVCISAHIYDASDILTLHHCKVPNYPYLFGLSSVASIGICSYWAGQPARWSSCTGIQPAWAYLGILALMLANRKQLQAQMLQRNTQAAVALLPDLERFVCLAACVKPEVKKAAAPVKREAKPALAKAPAPRRNTSRKPVGTPARAAGKRSASIPARLRPLDNTPYRRPSTPGKAGQSIFMGAGVH